MAIALKILNIKLQVRRRISEKNIHLFLFSEKFPFSAIRCFKKLTEQDCSTHAEALNFLTAFYGLWSSSNTKKLNFIKIKI